MKDRHYQGSKSFFPFVFKYAETWIGFSEDAPLNNIDDAPLNNIHAQYTYINNLVMLDNYSGWIFEVFSKHMGDGVKIQNNRLHSF